MSTIVSILEFILFFGLVVFFHEFGHFISAKATGIEVEEFGIGYKPRLAKLFTWKGTDITLNWIPFGGFNMIKGEGDESVEGGFAAAPIWKRLLVLISGPLMNFIVGIVVLIVLFAGVGAPAADKVQIMGVAPDSPAAMANLQVGDVITAVNDTKLTSLEDLGTLIQANLGKEISLTVLRDGKEMTVNLTPRLNQPEGEGSVGIEYTNAFEPQPFGASVGQALQSFGLLVKETALLPYNLITGKVPTDQVRLVSVVGIYQIFNSANQMDQTSPVAAATPMPVYRLAIISEISIGLGLTNLLPIPALDGGHIFFMLPEIFFKKRVPQEIENAITSIFFIFLVGLMFYLSIKDLINPITMP